MIVQDISLEKRMTEANSAIVSRPPINNLESPVTFRNGNSAVICDFSQNNFEEWLENPTVTFIKSFPKIIKDDENIFVSPVKNSIKVKMKVKIGGKIPPIPIDSEDFVFLDE